MMISVIQMHGTAQVKGLFRLNSVQIGNSWARARAVLDSYSAGSMQYSMAGVPLSSGDSQGTMPMDIGLADEIGGLYDTQGKGKKGKGKLKGKKYIECYNCGKPGHYSNDWWGEKKAKGKGKGGGKMKSKEGKGEAQNEYFAGECGFCHTWGHKRSECRKLKAKKMEVDKKAGEAGVIDMTNDDDHYEIEEEHDSSWLFMIEELGDEGVKARDCGATMGLGREAAV
eukprot:13314144-Heterocapsa_arctica.AAC.1